MALSVVAHRSGRGSSGGSIDPALAALNAVALSSSTRAASDGPAVSGNVTTTGSPRAVWKSVVPVRVDASTNSTLGVVAASASSPVTSRASGAARSGVDSTRLCSSAGCSRSSTSIEVTAPTAHSAGVEDARISSRARHGQVGGQRVDDDQRKVPPSGSDTVVNRSVGGRPVSCEPGSWGSVSTVARYMSCVITRYR